MMLANQKIREKIFFDREFSLSALKYGGYSLTHVS